MTETQARERILASVPSRRIDIQFNRRLIGGTRFAESFFNLGLAASLSLEVSSFSCFDVPKCMRMRS
jgi:hypothetical protein